MKSDNTNYSKCEICGSYSHTTTDSAFWDVSFSANSH